jgi:hypothetical protein
MKMTHHEDTETLHSKGTVGIGRVVISKREWPIMVKYARRDVALSIRSQEFRPLHSPSIGLV